MKSIPKNKRNVNNVDVWTNFNRKFDFGNGATFSIIDRKGDDDAKGTTKLFYSNKAPKLPIKGQIVDIEYSSTQQDDEDLLHFLYSRMR